MKAIRIERFGGPDVMDYVDIDTPTPREGEVLVKVRAAGVGPWDGWIRSGRSALVGSGALPVTPGSDIAGSVEAVGPGVGSLSIGDEVYGVTNPRFTGGYAEFAIASSSMLARRPDSLSYAEAASVPVVAVTALQMLFEHAHLQRGQVVLVVGASGNVGGFALQMARAHGARVVAIGAPGDSDHLRELGADQVLEVIEGIPEFAGVELDAVIDTVGGDLQRRCVASLRPGGVLVSAVSALDERIREQKGVRSVFFYVDVTTRALEVIARLLDSGKLHTRVGIVMPLTSARCAHDMLEGTGQAPGGKIVLSVDI